MSMMIRTPGVQFEDLTEGQRRELASTVFDVLYENYEHLPDRVSVTDGVVYIVRAPNPNGTRDIVEVYADEDVAEENADDIADANKSLDREDISVEKRVIHCG